MLKMAGMVVGGIVVLGFLFFAYRSFSAQEADPNLGLDQGQLKPCPDKPNCISTFATNELHKAEAWDLTEAPEEILAKIKIFGETQGAQFKLQTPTYMHMVFRSALFRYPDDVEIFIDEPGRKIHFRSASRVGHSDMGVNRERMDSIRSSIGIN